MNTNNITHILKNHPKTGATVLGAVPSDGIPDLDRFPYAVVINTEPHNDRGRHWVAVYVESNDAVEFFDSYGDLPNSNIASFLSHFPRVRRHTTQFQSLVSKVCAHYCIFFLVKRCSRCSFSQIVSMLQRHLPRTDAFVAEYVKRLLR